MSQVDVRLTYAGLQQAGQAPLVQSSAAPRVAISIPSLRRRNVLKLNLVVRLHSLRLYAKTLWDIIRSAFPLSVLLHF